MWNLKQTKLKYYFVLFCNYIKENYEWLYNEWMLYSGKTNHSSMVA